MPGTKRTHSFAFPYDHGSKLTKRKSSIRVSASAPVEDPSSTPPSLRRASTMSLEEEPTTTKVTLKAKRSSVKPSSMLRKSSSLVEEGALVTRLSGLRSGSVVGETSLASLTSKKSSLSKPKSALSKSESIRVTPFDDTELTGAVASLKKVLSTESSKLSKKSSLVTVSSVSALKKLSSTKSTSSRSGSFAAMDISEASTSDDPADSAPLPPNGLMEIAISFDTTGSMYGYLEEVRAKVQDLVQRLQADIPGIRISVIAHGDYCDESNYIVKWVDFGASLPEICDFVKNVSRTGGGDGPECYELVLQRVGQVLSWTPGSQRVLVMIGDDEPHHVGYRYGGKTYNIDWKEECAHLKDMNVKIYGVHAGLGIRGIDFFNEISRVTGGIKLKLQNFSSIFDFIMMICYKEANPDMMTIYQQEILDREGRIAADVTAMTDMFGVKSKFTPSAPKKAKLFTKKLSVTKKTTKKLATSKKPAMAKKAKTGKAIKATKKVTAGKKARTTKKDVKSITKAAAKAKKAAKKAAVKKAAAKKAAAKKAIKKKKLLKASLRKKRENLDDDCMTQGPLKTIEWSKWEKAIVPELPRNKSRSKYTALKAMKGFRLKTLVDDSTKERAIYEVAVELPGSSKLRKKYTMYIKFNFGLSNRGHWVANIFKTRNNRFEANNCISQGCSIYVRRGALLSTIANRSQIKENEKYIRQNFDYAWNKYMWRRTKCTKNVGHKFQLSHRLVKKRRPDKTYILSRNTL